MPNWFNDYPIAAEFISLAILVAATGAVWMFIILRSRSEHPRENPEEDAQIEVEYQRAVGKHPSE